MHTKLVYTIPVKIMLEHIRKTPLSWIKEVGDIQKSVELQNLSPDKVKDKCDFPYTDALIRIRSIHPEHILPTSYYELRTEKEKQERIREELIKEQEIDILKLGTGEFSENNRDIAGLIVKINGNYFTIMPTISEFPFDFGYGEPGFLLLNHGLHRMKQAIGLGSDVSTVVIKGVKFPYYALANPHLWEQNKIVEKVPEMKKAYSCSEPYRLYRNFNHGFVLPTYYPQLRKSGVTTLFFEY